MSFSEQIAKLQEEVQALKGQLGALATPDNVATTGPDVADPEASQSAIKQADPPQGLKTGSVQGASGLKTGGLETKALRESQEAEQAVAEQFEPDLAGRNGALQRFRAVREIAETVNQESNNSLVVSSADGAALSGTWPFLSLKAGVGGGRSLADPTNFEAPPLPFAMSGGGSGTVTINSGTVWIGSQDFYLERNTIGAGSESPVYINFELLPAATNVGTADSPAYEINGFKSTPIQKPHFSSTKIQQFAEINTLTGAVVKTGKFSVQLGVVGNPIQNRYGPLTVVECGGSGMITVVGPAYAFYDPSNPNTGE
jgi:hypothetical protein